MKDEGHEKATTEQKLETAIDIAHRQTLRTESCEAENTRRKKQVGSMKSALMGCACLLGVRYDGSGSWPTDARGLYEQVKKALSDTDGEAWINEIKAEVWEEAAKMTWPDCHCRPPCRCCESCSNAILFENKAKALRSKGGERAP